MTKAPPQPTPRARKRNGLSVRGAKDARQRDVAILGAFMSKGGRLPDFAQRRLDDLLRRNATSGGLSAAEKRELKEMLAYIDQKTIELLTYEVAQRRNGRTSSANAAPWEQFVQKRLKQLCTR